VEVVYDGDPSESRVIPELDSLISTSLKKVTSVTGELELDYGTGVCTLNAPKARGVTGFVKDAGGPFTLGGLTLSSSNDYATVLAVALDDLPLEHSRSILVQVGTVCRPYGWEVQDAQFEVDKETVSGKRVVSVGGAPWNVVNTDLSLTLKNSSIGKAVLCTPNGYPVRELDTETGGSGLTVILPPDAMFVHLK
jgi:hypothetical protein